MLRNNEENNGEAEQGKAQFGGFETNFKLFQEQLFFAINNGGNLTNILPGSHWYLIWKVMVIKI